MYLIGFGHNGSVAPSTKVKKLTQLGVMLMYEIWYMPRQDKKSTGYMTQTQQEVSHSKSKMKLWR